MGPVYKGKFLPEKVLGHGFVCQQHEIFDNPGGHIALIRFDFQRPALPVQNNFRLRKIKINGAAFSALFSQYGSQFFHSFKHGNQLLVFRSLCLILVFQYFPYTGVAHAAVYPDYRFRQFVIHQVPLFVNQHDTAQGQTVFSGIQGTDTVG